MLPNDWANKYQILFQSQNNLTFIHHLKSTGLHPQSTWAYIKQSIRYVNVIWTSCRHPHLGGWSTVAATNKCFPQPPPGGAIGGSIGGTEAEERWALGIDLGPSLPRPGAPEFSCSPRCIIGPSGAKSGAKWELSDGRVTVGVGGGSTDPGHSDSLEWRL